MTTLKKRGSLMLAGALLGAMVLSGAAIGFRSIGAYAEEPGTEIFVDTATQETAESDPFYHEVPYFVGVDDDSHYCFGVYRFRQEDPHADHIAFKYMENGQDDAFKLYATHNQIANYVVVPNVGSVSFSPHYYVCRAYCSLCGQYSSYNDDLRGHMSGQDLEFVTHRGIVGKTNIYTVIPTSFDQSQNTWEHGAAPTNYILFSIAYNGEIADGEIKIPSIFTRSVSVTLGGVTFTVRSGPNQVSVKASEAVVCNDYNTMFAFQTEIEP